VVCPARQHAICRECEPQRERSLDHRRILAEAPLIDETVDVGMDTRGDAMVVWHEEALKGGGSAIWARIRPTGRGWGTARTIPGAHGGPPSLAIDARGDALVTWQDKRGIEAAARPAGGSWQKPDTVSAHEHAGPGVEGDGLAALDADSSKTGSRVRRWNGDMALDRLVEVLMDQVGRQARRRVAEAIRKADR
jgi:hypothetical protein